MSDDLIKPLKDLFQEFFESCIPKTEEEAQKITNEFFSNGFINCIDKFFKSGHAYTYDVGVIGEIPFVGMGVSTSLSGNFDDAKNELLNALNSIDNKVKDKQSKGEELPSSTELNKMYTDGTSSSLQKYFNNCEVKCLVVGNATGTSKGTMKFDTLSTLSGLLLAEFLQYDRLKGESSENFNNRLDIGENKTYKSLEDRFNVQVSKFIQTLMEVPLMVTTNGEGQLSAVSGQGLWSFEVISSIDDLLKKLGISGS